MWVSLVVIWWARSPAALSLFVLASIILLSCRCQNGFCSKFLDPVFCTLRDAPEVCKHIDIDEPTMPRNFDQICKCHVNDVLPASCLCRSELNKAKDVMNRIPQSELVRRVPILVWAPEKKAGTQALHSLVQVTLSTATKNLQGRTRYEQFRKLS